MINNGENDPDTDLARSISSGSDISESTQSSAEDSEEDADLETEALQSYLAEIESIVDRLFDLSILIRGTSRNFRSNRAAMHLEKDAEGVDVLEEFNRIVALKIKWLCRETEDWLVERLAKVITMRRQQFYYQRAHYRKLTASNISQLQRPLPELRIKQTGITFDTTAPQMEPKEPTADLAAPRTTRSEATRKTYATMATEFKQEEGQKTKLAIANIAPSEKRIGENIFPDPPKEPQGKAFQCNQCFQIQPPEMRNRRTWR